MAGRDPFQLPRWSQIPPEMDKAAILHGLRLKVTGHQQPYCCCFVNALFAFAIFTMCSFFPLKKIEVTELNTLERKVGFQIFLSVTLFKLLFI